MPRATTCLLNDGAIDVEVALRQREQSKRGKGTGRLDYRCIECRRPVRPHRDGGHAAAHFEHLERNPNCRLSDPVR